MANDLREYLAERPAQGFQPVPHYVANGDFITFFFRPERCHALRVDDLLTVYRAMGSNELVGCKIERVRHILRTADDFGVHLDETLRLGLFLFIGASLATDAEQQQQYAAIRRLVQDATLNSRDLLAAG